MSLVGAWESLPDGVMFSFTDDARGWASRQFYTHAEVAALSGHYRSLKPLATGTDEEVILAARLDEIPTSDLGYGETA